MSIVVVVVLLVVFLSVSGLLVGLNRRAKRPTVLSGASSAPQGSVVAPPEEDSEPTRHFELKAPPPRHIEGSLTRSRGMLGMAIARMKSRRVLTEEFWIELEEALLLSDVGLEVSEGLVTSVRHAVTRRGVTSTEEAIDMLRLSMEESLVRATRSLDLSGPVPSVLLFVGVNGVGKTTSIGKLASKLSGDHKVVVAAGDTFRAAATEQLETWAERSGVSIVRGTPGGDPAAVIYDAISHAAAVCADVVLADTAGRLQNRFNLMEELKKIRRVAEKASGTVTEVLLVLDATTGQNGLIQAKGFSDAAGVTGVILTKLDGTAKGGVAFAIERELGIPIKMVGIGEGIGDLVDFDPVAFVREITGESHPQR